MVVISVKDNAPGHSRKTFQRDIFKGDGRHTDKVVSSLKRVVGRSDFERKDVWRPGSIISEGMSYL